MPRYAGSQAPPMRRRSRWGFRGNLDLVKVTPLPVPERAGGRLRSQKPTLMPRSLRVRRPLSPGGRGDPAGMCDMWCPDPRPLTLDLQAAPTLSTLSGVVRRETPAPARVHPGSPARSLRRLPRGRGSVPLPIRDSAPPSAPGLASVRPSWTGPWCWFSVPQRGRDQSCYFQMRLARICSGRGSRSEPWNTAFPFQVCKACLRGEKKFPSTRVGTANHVQTLRRCSVCSALSLHWLGGLVTRQQGGTVCGLCSSSSQSQEDARLLGLGTQHVLGKWLLGWMDGWMGEWITDGWIMDGWIMDRWMDDGWMDGWMMDGWIMNGWVDGWMCSIGKCFWNGWIIGWVMGGWMDNG
ncbi:uncharacterized protein LOC129395719 isoform X2 [Pan paniscus]|uniref:uncharacterized protein LOC129395719 isoform X2 n=1 Tax=Pan paniscus TaxID=9597 RepID=UPI0030057C9F